MKKKQKLTLRELEVKSFVTQLDEVESGKIRGGTAVIVDPEYTDLRIFC